MINPLPLLCSRQKGRAVPIPSRLSVIAAPAQFSDLPESPIPERHPFLVLATSLSILVAETFLGDQPSLPYPKQQGFHFYHIQNDMR